MSLPNNGFLTQSSGAPVASNNFSQTVGPRGPVLLQDVFFLEKMAHFDREVIPERRMHAKGSGAYGTFTVTHDITKYTKASIFSRVGKKTDLFSRFSTAAGERGAADAERDLRGFAIKFYTDEGNWDLVGNNSPVFYVRDALKFPDLNHVVKRDPMTNLRNINAKLDFLSLQPESLHQLTIDYSDRGIPLSLRFMNGFGSHTFSMINANNERHWVKFHFVCQQPIRNLQDDEAALLVGMDRESSQRDLFEAISKNNFPKWKLCIQVMTEQQANESKVNPFDLTKVWRHGEFPLIDVGIMELNRNPDNYFAEVEQAAFSPANVVPGISFSPDRMLQGRLFSYGDAARYRIGINHWQVPVNRPRCPYFINHRDGAMRVLTNGMEGCTYEPNSYGQYKETKDAEAPGLKVAEGAKISIYSHREDDDDYYTQPGLLFNLLDAAHRQRLCKRFAGELAMANEIVRTRMLGHLAKVGQEYHDGVKAVLDTILADASKTETVMDKIHKIGNMLQRVELIDSKDRTLVNVPSTDIGSVVSSCPFAHHHSSHEHHQKHSVLLTSDQNAQRLQEFDNKTSPKKVPENQETTGCFGSSK